ncbi:AraC family transcriptional regulator [Thiospirochaeta perfilievii]|uniref:AraC family transcriptional regulator n=1 Tax=Thiospirochaeta perfilievii TaxID=252967 RepID=A0A5C1QDP4_9SPIO|nr:helix-turn-helix domain-containing protein [Thiospirochaeta perfilievii]QEN04322.1 AraC family transcriptional regulator [Thiospirochaeta perfilievii]
MKHINRIFITFLIAYLILILIPLLTGISMNRAIVLEYEQHVKKSHLSNLQKTQEILEGFIDDIKWSTYQLAGNTKLLRLISDDKNQITNMEKSQLIRDIMIELRHSILYNTSNNSIFYIYLKNQDIIITPYSVYRHSDFNTSINFFNMDGISSKDWHNLITTKIQHGKIFPVRSTIIEDFKNKPMIPYVQSIPLNSSKKLSSIQGAIVYLIGEADLVKFLDYQNLPLGGYSYISDDTNKIISYVSNSVKNIEPIELVGNEGMIELNIDGEKKFIIYTTSSRNSWKYVSVLPTEWVLKNVRFYHILSITVMLLTLIICLFVAYKISKRWSKPIETTFESIEEFLKTDNIKKESFQSLNISVNELIDRGEVMQDELLNQKFFLHNAFVNRVINGFFNDEKSLEKYLSHLGFELNENQFSVVILSQCCDKNIGSTESFDELNRLKNIVKNRLQKNFVYRIMISEQDNSDIILIVLSNNIDNHVEVLKNELISFLPNLPPLYKENLVIGLGYSVDSLMHIHKSYLEAKEIVSSSSEGIKPLILDISDIDKKLDHYYYPLEIESRLINSIKAGNSDGMESILTILSHENLKKRTLDKKRLESFISNLLTSVYRVKSHLCSENRDLIDEYYKTGVIDFANIKELYNQLCSNQNKNKKSHNNTLIEEIEEYLKNNFNDKNLSLNAVGDYFSITESYLSFFFKEQTGINFSTYLEEIRVENAKELLLNTTDPIHYIAGEVGYNSDKTFRRVFQKTLNISPSKFRRENTTH